MLSGSSLASAAGPLQGCRPSILIACTWWLRCGPHLASADFKWSSPGQCSRSVVWPSPGQCRGHKVNLRGGSANRRPKGLVPGLNHKASQGVHLVLQAHVVLAGLVATGRPNTVVAERHLHLQRQLWGMTGSQPRNEASAQLQAQQAAVEAGGHEAPFKPLDTWVPAETFQILMQALPRGYCGSLT